MENYLIYQKQFAKTKQYLLTYYSQPENFNLCLINEISGCYDKIDLDEGIVLKSRESFSLGLDSNRGDMADLFLGMKSCIEGSHNTFLKILDEKLLEVEKLLTVDPSIGFPFSSRAIKLREDGVDHRIVMLFYKNSMIKYYDRLISSLGIEF